MHALISTSAMGILKIEILCFFIKKKIVEVRRTLEKKTETTWLSNVTGKKKTPSIETSSDLNQVLYKTRKAKTCRGENFYRFRNRRCWIIFVFVLKLLRERESST